MRNYQPQKNNPFWLPHDIYMRVQYIISGYDRMKRERENIIHASVSNYTTYVDANGVESRQFFIHGGNTGDPTGEKALKLAALDNDLHAIDGACSEICVELKRCVNDAFNPLKAYWSYDYYNYMHIRRGPDDLGPSRRTWNRYKTRLSWKIAKKIKLI